MKRLVVGALLAAAASANAAGVKVTWQEPEKFTDVRPTTETREAFLADVTHELDRVFEDLAKKMPDKLLWEITVTDLDLAGEVRPVFARRVGDVRVVKELYWPRITLSYTLKDEQGQTVASGKEELRDMNFMMRLGVPSGHTRFQYEEQMLKDWFRKLQKNKVLPTR